MVFKEGTMKGCPFSELDKEMFKKDYLSNMPISKMSEKYGVNFSSINNWRKALGLTRKRIRKDLSIYNKNNKKYLGKENPAYGYRKYDWLTKPVLKKLYKIYGDYRSISLAIGISSVTLQKMMNEKEMMIKHGRKCKFSKDLLQELYDKSGSVVEVGRMLGVDSGSVALHMRQYGIKYSTNREFKKQKHFWKKGQRRAIRERDEHICFECGVKKENKNHAVHHIFYDVSIDDERSLVTLCHSCHSRTNGNKEYWINRLTERLSSKYGYCYEDMKERGDFGSYGC